MLISRHTQFGARLARNAPDEGGGGDAPDFSFIPSDYQGESGPDFSAFGAHYTETAAQLGRLTEEMEGLRAGIPEDPTGYEFTLPEDLEYGDLDLPENFNPQIDPENPIFEELRAAMHQNGVKADFAKTMMGAFAKYQANLVAQQRARTTEEAKKLGPMAKQRTEAVRKALESRVPDAEFRDGLMSAITTAAGLRGLEALLSVNSTSPSPAPKGDNFHEIANPIERLNAINRARKAG